jgi:hypothetical protein
MPSSPKPQARRKIVAPSPVIASRPAFRPQELRQSLSACVAEPQGAVLAVDKRSAFSIRSFWRPETGRARTRSIKRGAHAKMAIHRDTGFWMPTCALPSRHAGLLTKKLASSSIKGYGRACACRKALCSGCKLLRGDHRRRQPYLSARLRFGARRRCLRVPRMQEFEMG